ncbi:MAG: ABC transporter ATP-binding protein [Nitrospiraceae bacterium]|jgi:lipopolysaccharide transport system ATP-binding protein|nr:ABC transporter ATP-binding protein [Nitrospiraceae bacterium]
MAVAIAVENLSKKYVIGHQARERYTALRDVLANGAKRFVHKVTHPFAKLEDDATHETFWALKDINFNIEQGDRVGIIGRNGAGKSTLLKILSRITEPTSGRVKIRGRVSSLLEVGTGFHPELTGRENIFLNGAILGMGKAEITRKFDEIVAFAEVEKFLDTPVKRYSSGMYVRLAFAVAAHLEPDTLIVDEVLAVGDAQFQRKCLGKMEEVGKEGRTVIFVSHNMGALRALCERGVFLANGQMMAEGNVSNVIKQYMCSVNDNASGEMCWTADTMPGDSDLKLKRVSVVQVGKIERVVKDIRDISFDFELVACRDLVGVAINLILGNSKGDSVLHTISNLNSVTPPIVKGTSVVRYTLPSLLLAAGNYSVTVAATIPNVHTFFHERDVASFQVETCNSQVHRYPEHAWKGILNPQIGEWSCQ